MPILLSKLPKKGNKYKYRGIWFEIDKPLPFSTRKGKKKMVLARKGSYVKLVHFGALGYSDFTKHKDPKRRARYRKRHRAILLKSGKPAYKDKWQAAYWSWHDLW